MILADRVNAFVSLGQYLGTVPDPEFMDISRKANLENGWFTPESVALAFRANGVMLDASKLNEWTSRIAEPKSIKTIGVAMAGNIPLVGFHDFLVVLISGHQLQYKPSSRDGGLMDLVTKRLVAIEPRFADRITRSDNLKGVDAVIATGSDNSSRYFEYYFRNIPHIIRKNRVSCAVLQGDEPAEEIGLLGGDIFNYYGLGCRNISAVFIPRDLDLTSFLGRLEAFGWVMENHKYANNYVYQKSLAMLNQEKFLDTGFLLCKESDKLISPVGVMHYIYYENLDDLKNKVALHRDKIQVTVSARGWFDGSIPFGKSQYPRVSDYADGVDTLKFLNSLEIG